MKKGLILAAASLSMAFGSPVLARDANKTTYPIVFAHGMAGFDDILGYDYWGDDYGVFVLDTCQWGEYYCNHDINSSQESFVASVTPFQSSEVRGYELYQDIENYLASSGHSYVNVIGHSQGGLDLRKAAHLPGNPVQPIDLGGLGVAHSRRSFLHTQGGYRPARVRVQSGAWTGGDKV